MTYEIRRNDNFRSNEIYFDGKPSESVRSALKAIKFRWHSVKKCWYGFAQEHEIVNAILSASTDEEPATVYTEGYLGGGAYYGSKSRRGLYGTDLAKAIRADIKNAGIKGVTIASKSGNIQATVRTTSADVVPEEVFIANYSVSGSFGWVDYTDECGCRRTVSLCDFYQLPEDIRERIRIEHAKREYARVYADPARLNRYNLDKYTGFTATGLNKLKAVQAIIELYRFDESNAMVDYFHTNFYYEICTKPAAAALA